MWESLAFQKYPFVSLGNSFKYGQLIKLWKVNKKLCTTDSRPIYDWKSTGILPVEDCLLSVNRYTNQVSSKYWLTCRSSIGRYMVKRRWICLPKRCPRHQRHVNHMLGDIHVSHWCATDIASDSRPCVGWYSVDMSADLLTDTCLMALVDTQSTGAY